MMKNKFYTLWALAAISLASCSVEAPFKGQDESGSGQLSKLAFDLEVTGADKVTARAATEVNLDDFDIVIQTASSTPTTVATYKYSKMPEVITLQAGSYNIIAKYGENQEAAFEQPHFYGQSGEFRINANEINTDIGTIRCALENVKVSVYFHPNLYSHMDDDAYVEVYVNKNTPLHFKKQHSDEETAGYFRHDDVCTLTAVFHGVVDGVQLDEVKTLDGVQKGNHYKLTFTRHEHNGEESGEIDGGIDINASVTVVDLNEDITIADDEPLDDSERPKEGDPSEGGDQPGKDDPSDPSEPDTPDDPGITGPEVVLDESSTVKFDIVNDINPSSVIVLNIKSESEKGLTKFLVGIETDAEDLKGMSNLDLIEPGDNVLGLQNLGLLKEDQETLKGETSVSFDITGFMDLLCGLGSYKHVFTITIGDEYGDVVKTLILNVK